MSDDFEVIWHDPPMTGKWGPRLERYIELLRANSPQWGELPPVKDEDGEHYYPQSVLTTLKQRWGKADFEWRSVSSSTNRNEVRVYGRCLNPDPDPERAARANLKAVGK